MEVERERKRNKLENIHRGRQGFVLVIQLAAAVGGTYKTSLLVSQSSCKRRVPEVPEPSGREEMYACIRTYEMATNSVCLHSDTLILRMFITCIVQTVMRPETFC
jgi:hypothetical protein